MGGERNKTEKGEGGERGGERNKTERRGDGRGEGR